LRSRGSAAADDPDLASDGPDINEQRAASDCAEEAESERTLP
jgi:hypothetical protein